MLAFPTCPRGKAASEVFEIVQFPWCGVLERFKPCSLNKRGQKDSASHSCLWLAFLKMELLLAHMDCMLLYPCLQVLLRKSLLARMSRTVRPSPCLQPAWLQLCLCARECVASLSDSVLNLRTYCHLAPPSAMDESIVKNLIQIGAPKAHSLFLQEHTDQ